MTDFDGLDVSQKLTAICIAVRCGRYGDNAAE